MNTIRHLQSTVGEVNRANGWHEGTVCECGHTALTHHGVDGRVRRDAGCQTNTRRDDWCRCPLTCLEVMTDRRSPNGSLRFTEDDVESGGWVA